jgi:hypothetical protein
MGALAKVELPAFGRGTEVPQPITVEEYEQRLEVVCGRLAQESVDVLVVYGDREHFATITFLTGIHLDDRAFTSGNIPGWLPPYALDITKALVAE